MEPGFGEYIDDLVVWIADNQTGLDLTAVNLLFIHSLHFKDKPNSWMRVAPEEIERLGYGARQPLIGENYIRINGAGLRRAHEVRFARRPKTWRDYLRTVTRSDWLAIAALIISAAALFKPG